MGPYVATPQRGLEYRGTRHFPPAHDVLAHPFPVEELAKRVHALASDAHWAHLTAVNDAVFAASTAFFTERRARFVPLPLTTRMISSPGAVHGREAISYTTDTSPIRLRWFDLPDEGFLAESSQIYLELALLPPNTREVYCIYSSFRKEEADSTHLSEFHHIEFEGHLSQDANVDVLLGLIRAIVERIIEDPAEPLLHFLDDAEIEDLSRIVNDPVHITFREALDLLRRSTGDPRYGDFTLRHFGAWEEVHLTALLGDRLVVLREFPLLEVPFYHRPMNRAGVSVAEAADIIWPGYREIAGSGARVATEAELRAKATTFQLPEADYRPYMQSRELPTYRPTAGFGLGWERLVQAVLSLPHIWDGTAFPRGHLTLTP